MVGKRTSRRLAADNRAVSAVIGFILVFGILVLLLTVYQAQIVPQQNAQTEFEHFEDSKNELIELRNTISTAGQADVSQFPSVTLGTNYQTRLLTINPPPPAGTLQTSDEYPIIIQNKSGDSLTIPTRFLEYQPGYNELTVGPTQYEHSVLYLDERDRGNNVSIIKEQNLVKDGKVRITALQNKFEQTGTNRVTLELYPEDDVDSSEFPDPDGENLNVTIPTQLDEDEYWNKSLEDAGDIYQGVDTEVHGEEIHALNLSVEEDDLEVNTVGIQLEPDEGAAKNIELRGENGNGNGNGNGESDTIKAGDIEDLEIDGTRDQDIKFELVEERLLNNERVIIDLENVNNEMQEAGNEDDGYANAEVDSPDGSQDDPNAFLSEGGDTLIFEAETGNVDPGEYTIVIEDISVPDTDSLKGTYFVEFTREDTGDTDTGTVEIVDD